MSNLTNYAENKIIDALLRGQSLGAPATWYVAALSAAADPEAGTLTEITGGSYARVAVTASLANFSGTQSAGSTTASSGSSGTSSNNNAITFPTPTGNWSAQATHIALMDANSGGNAWVVGALAAPKTVNNGDPAPSFPAAALSVTFA
jgi:hypothetical protein